MLIGVEGLPGGGKTAICIRYVKKDYENGRKIISNTPLYDIEYEVFDIEQFLSNTNEYRKKIENATILLDEITMYMDCRLPHGKASLLMGYMVLQKRKRNVDIYYTTQDLDLVDYKRLVKYTDIIIFCQEVFIFNSNGEKQSVKDWRNYSIVEVNKRSDNLTQFNMNIKPYYNFYDTNYIIEPLVVWKKEQKEKNVQKKQF